MTLPPKVNLKILTKLTITVHRIISVNNVAHSHLKLNSALDKMYSALRKVENVAPEVSED